MPTDHPHQVSHWSSDSEDRPARTAPLGSQGRGFPAEIAPSSPIPLFTPQQESFTQPVINAESNPQVR